MAEAPVPCMCHHPLCGGGGVPSAPLALPIWRHAPAHPGLSNLSANGFVRNIHRFLERTQTPSDCGKYRAGLLSRSHSEKAGDGTWRVHQYSHRDFWNPCVPAQPLRWGHMLGMMHGYPAADRGKVSCFIRTCTGQHSLGPGETSRPVVPPVMHAFFSLHAGVLSPRCWLASSCPARPPDPPWPWPCCSAPGSLHPLPSGSGPGHQWAAPGGLTAGVGEGVFAAPPRAFGWAGVLQPEVLVTPAG